MLKPYAGVPLQGILLSADNAKASFICVPIDAGCPGNTVECYFVLEWLSHAKNHFIYRMLNYEVKAYGAKQDHYYHFYFRDQFSVALTATWPKESIAPRWWGDVVVSITNSFGIPLDAKKEDKVNVLSLFGRYSEMLCVWFTDRLSTAMYSPSILKKARSVCLTSGKWKHYPPVCGTSNCDV